MFIFIFPLFFRIRQVHIQPVIITSNSIISRPTRAPVADIMRVGSIIALFESGGYTDDDAGWLLVRKPSTFVVSIVLEVSLVVDDGHTLKYTVVGT